MLRDDKTFICGKGVALNPLIRRLSRGTTFSSDGADALVQRVERIELTGPPTWAVNNIIRRHDRLPIKLFGA